MQLKTPHAIAAGRTLMAVIFLVAGVRKALTYSATAAYFAKLGIPAADIVLPLTILLEIGGGVALVFGWRLPLVAGVLGIFTMAAAFLAHAFWAVDPAQFNAQLNNFLKNVAMAGGFLILATAAKKA
ncbi:DoxX family protein [Ramlibacter sp. WS9]|uniref:DoxX family protein n=1 Tax=Ramlibacter sp. WS9 TaxID=1882741 RepID=UPI0011441A50|nr:DoxX family protein [Ramlibacter sp. WS9]ROZ66090.1 DoxX family protein [Ramlibacter sp. WS9]